MTPNEKDSLSRILQAIEKMDRLKREVLLSLGNDLASLRAIEDAKEKVQKSA